MKNTLLIIAAILLIGCNKEPAITDKFIEFQHQEQLIIIQGIGKEMYKQSVVLYCIENMIYLDYLEIDKIYNNDSIRNAMYNHQMQNH